MSSAFARATGKSKSKIEGSILYTVDILCYVECCTRQLWCSSIIFYNITSITHDHQLIYPILNISIYLQALQKVCKKNESQNSLGGGGSLSRSGSGGAEKYGLANAQGQNYAEQRRWQLQREEDAFSLESLGDGDDEEEDISHHIEAEKGRKSEEMGDTNSSSIHNNPAAGLTITTDPIGARKDGLAFLALAYGSGEQAVTAGGSLKVDLDLVDQGYSSSNSSPGSQSPHSVNSASSMSPKDPSPNHRERGKLSPLAPTYDGSPNSVNSSDSSSSNSNSINSNDASGVGVKRTASQVNTGSLSPPLPLMGSPRSNSNSSGSSGSAGSQSPPPPGRMVGMTHTQLPPLRPKYASVDGESYEEEEESFLPVSQKDKDKEKDKVNGNGNGNISPKQKAPENGLNGTSSRENANSFASDSESVSSVNSMGSGATKSTGISFKMKKRKFL